MASLQQPVLAVLSSSSIQLRCRWNQTPGEPQDVRGPRPQREAAGFYPVEQTLVEDDAVLHFIFKYNGM